MKKVFLILFVIIIATPFTHAQKKGKAFTGELTISISYDGTWDPATLAQQPREMTIIVGAERQKSVILASGASISTIVNTKDSSVTTLINAMGMKFFIKQTKEMILESIVDGEQPKIVYIDETKVVAGYTCKKAEYITLDEYEDEITTIVYYTEEIGTPAMNFGGQFNGLVGYPMEYIMKTDEGTITFSVTALKSKKIKDTEFLIPTDYEELSPEQVRGMFGG